MDVIQLSGKQNLNFTSELVKYGEQSYLTWSGQNYVNIFPNLIQDNFDCTLEGFFISQIAELITAGGIECEAFPKLSNPLYLSRIIESFYGHGIVYLVLRYETRSGNNSGWNLVDFYSAEKVRYMKPSQKDGIEEITSFAFHENWGFDLKRRCEDDDLITKGFCQFKHRHTRKNLKKPAILDIVKGDERTKTVKLYPIYINGFDRCEYPKVKHQKTEIQQAFRTLGNVIKIDNQKSENSLFADGYFACYVEDAKNSPNLRDYEDHDFEDGIKQMLKEIRETAGSVLAIPVEATDNVGESPGSIKFVPMEVHKSDKLLEDAWNRAIPIIFMAHGLTIKSLIGWTLGENSTNRDGADTHYNSKIEQIQAKFDVYRNSFASQFMQLLEKIGKPEEIEFNVKTYKVVSESLVMAYQTANQVQERYGLEITEEGNTEIATKTGTNEL